MIIEQSATQRGEPAKCYAVDGFCMCDCPKGHTSESGVLRFHACKCGHTWKTGAIQTVTPCRVAMRGAE